MRVNKNASCLQGIFGLREAYLLTHTKAVYTVPSSSEHEVRFLSEIKLCVPGDMGPSDRDLLRRVGGRKHVRFYSRRLATPTRDSKATMSHNKASTHLILEVS